MADGEDAKKIEGKIEDEIIETSVFDQLEKDFQEVLSELYGEKSLERFRIEYEKLHRALKKSHENEKALAKRCKELNAEIVSNAAKVKTALKLSQEDQHTIASLKKEIEKAWRMVDGAHEREAKAKETIQQLKLEISNLSKLVEQGAGISAGQESTVAELLKAKEDLTRERDAQVQTITKLRGEVQEYLEKVRILESDRISAERKIQSLKDMIATKKAETEREQRRKARLEKELKDLRGTLEARTKEIEDRQTKISEGQDQMKRLEQALRDQKDQNDKLGKEYEQLNSRFLKLQQDLEDQIHNNTQLLAENSERQVSLKVKEEEVREIKNEVAKVNKLRNTLMIRIRQLEQQRDDVERERDTRKAEISSLERDLEMQKRASEQDRKQIEEMKRERELLTKQLRRASGVTQKQIDLVRIHENQKKTLEQEIASYKSEAQKQRKLVYQLEQEREKYGQSSSDSQHKYLHTMEEVKIREMTILDLQKKIAEAEAKLKQQQNLYEAVRGDRNLYSKNLIEAQDEIAEMKRKFKIMNHQIEQLKEEIKAKDDALVKEHFDRKKVEKEKESLKHELEKVKNQINEAEQTINSQKAEIAKLNHIINEADSERQRQKKEYEVVLNERDILGTQLIRRNDELALLYEKIKIQQSTLNKGEVQYRERVEDIRLLKIKIADLKRELKILNTQVSNVDALRNEVLRLQRDLLTERTKVKALTEELQNPMNVHRWRKLEGSDPATYEMIQKIQMLQKRLIAKTEEVVEKDMLIEEKEKLYVELKNILARQPGPEVAEQLNIYQQNIREKTRQMKAMASELNMYQAQVQEYKYDIERVTRELQDVKKKYFEQKRREQQARNRQMDESRQKFEAHPPPDQPRFTGGGFSLNTEVPRARGEASPNNGVAVLGQPGPPGADV